MKIGIPASKFLFWCLMAFLPPGSLPAQERSGEKKRLDIVASLFPQYDFAKRIGGDRVRVRLLLPPGGDSHSFDPKPSDLQGIARADIFAYTGADMEPWAEKLLAAVDGSGTLRAVDVSAGIRLRENEEHNDGEEDDDADAAHHAHIMDPHVWLDPILAIRMADALLEAMLEADPDNAAHYSANAAALREDLLALDAECRDMVAGAKRRVLVFGGKFAFAYFAERYGLGHIGAYDSCGAGAEPSVKRILEITEYVGKNHIPVIYHEEFTEPRISAAIADATGCGMMEAHSLHNLSAAELASGVTFVELMRRNAAAFAGGLR